MDIRMDHWQGWTEEDARKYLSVPKDSDDKYSRGVLGVIAGSVEYPGAAALVCEATMRTGVGMVRFMGPAKAGNLVLTHRPEVVTQDGQVQAWVVGSGMAPNQISWRRQRFIRAKIQEGTPVVLDAGALSFAVDCRGPVLITPHYRELASLLRNSGCEVSDIDIKNEPQKWARFAADTLHVAVLLKGHISYVADKGSEIQLPPASPWLATAGTGDVLAGIVGALVATHFADIAEDPRVLSALAATGSLIHARAADLASKGGPITAMGVAHAIPTVMSDLLHKGK